MGKFESFVKSITLYSYPYDIPDQIWQTIIWHHSGYDLGSGVPT